MPDNFCGGILAGADLDGDALTLRLDQNVHAEHALPMLTLTLKKCADAPACVAVLQAHLESFTECTFYPEGRRRSLEISFDYSDNNDLTIRFADAATVFSPYTFDDLQRRLAWLTRVHDHESDESRKMELRYRKLTKSLRRELKKGADHAARKSAFFLAADPPAPDKSKALAGEASAYRKILALLTQLEKD